MSVTDQQQQPTDVETSDFENDPCKEELNTLLTNTSESKHILKYKTKKIESYRSILEVETEEAEALKNEIQNLTAEIQEMEATCTGFLPLDCCQVCE